MESSSNANAALTKATNKRKKTRAEMDAHNARCRSSRLRTKIRNSQTREENERIKKEMEEKTSELQQRVENEMLKHKRAVEEKRAIEAQMRQFPTSLKFEGQIFSTSEQMKKYILSRTYEPHHQGLDNTNITASDRRPSFVANNIGFDAPDNNLSSCDPAAGPDNTNITASDSRPSFVANNIAFDAPNNNLSFCDPAAGVPDFGAGFSFDANDDEFFEWMTLKFDTAAGISETTNLVVENQNSELVNQIDHNALSDHSSCDPAAGPYNTNITACVPCPSFVANYKCFDVPNNKLSSSDHVAGISQTKNSVVEIPNNELVNQIDHKAMVQRSELSPAQRSAEKERDRQHMPEYKIKPELKRLRNMVVKYEEIAPLFNTISQLAEESKQMNGTEPYLASRIQEVDNIVRQHIEDNCLLNSGNA